MQPKAFQLELDTIKGLVVFRGWLAPITQGDCQKHTQNDALHNHTDLSQLPAVPSGAEQKQETDTANTTKNQCCLTCVACWYDDSILMLNKRSTDQSTDATSISCCQKHCEVNAHCLIQYYLDQGKPVMMHLCLLRVMTIPRLKSKPLVCSTSPSSLIVAFCSCSVLICARK